ncbi:DUF4189 domain-containing protein [Burkholderia cenocepacia]|uniref:DUF4189 domain-containing protein n=1 Tax=Burkholderia cenocepacia TaxID=95486 RepID=A0AAD0N9Q6_9BURK|nr:DUF4189 domain-containing protein [Burkholderia cenocepacia]AWG27518.1 hypothetical protein B9Z07_00650 [Burkholderia cenocepacia]MBR8305603.1 DUF4189 domain-containing protein [Burkholderia cenocepacia]MDR8076331.1 DUF4189 domain-containing protein [Burkholderia cenocepacia]PRE35959.1 hypothetical protein C6P63_15225 [Burkholderia cenocepacia]RQU82146.1 DUF4189 domain-containing protein [Burkholderia cenocepacia]
MRFKILPIVCLVGISFTAHAQVACPPGWIPYSASSCGPDPDGQGQAASPPQRQISWISRWGAISTDGKAGALGTSTDLDSQQQAERAALSQCKAKGGTQCEIDLSYANGCAVMLVGDNTHNSNMGQTIDDATAKAMKVCTANDKNCRVFYSGCSLPGAAR